MAKAPVFRLGEALLLFLFLLVPMMLMLGAAEGTTRRPTLLFWVLWLLPFLVLPPVGHDARLPVNVTGAQT